VRIQTEEEVRQVEEQRRRQAEALERKMQMQHAAAPTVEGEAPVAEVPSTAQQAPRRLEASEPAPRPAPVVRDMPKVGRNDPCPCGSGKKFKQCHGALV
jgi:preprotein translocase subunit SecA